LVGRGLKLKGGDSGSPVVDWAVGGRGGRTGVKRGKLWGRGEGDNQREEFSAGRESLAEGKGGGLRRSGFWKVSRMSRII